MPTKKKIYLLGCIVLLSGCHQHYGVLVKRESEQNCPTDIRQTVPWCAGEDAIFRCPCGPNEQFHGHKPTCWRPWQSSGAQWRDLHCEPLGATCETGLPESFSGEQVPQPIEVLVPTQSGLAMPLPASSEREPSDLPPTILLKVGRNYPGNQRRRLLLQSLLPTISIIWISSGETPQGIAQPRDHLSPNFPRRRSPQSHQRNRCFCRRWSGKRRVFLSRLWYPTENLPYRSEFLASRCVLVRELKRSPSPGNRYRVARRRRRQTVTQYSSLL